MSTSTAGSWVLAPVEGLEQSAVDTLRFLSVDAIEKAGSGHPGLPLGAAPMAYVLWSRFLVHNPADPAWFDRDRFILSAGHGSMLLYSLLHLTGYDLSLDELKTFRQWGSKAAGHPERGRTPGVEVTTGPLGQGFGNGVGMAIAEAHLATRFNRPGFDLIDHHTYGIVSDGDLMEGVAAETASLAGHLKLGKLIYLYDDNRVTLSASTQYTCTEDTARRFQAYGWHTCAVEDGNDLEAIGAALNEARSESDRPSLILVRTHLGFGSPHKQDSFQAHGSPLGAEETRLTKARLGWPEAPAFRIPDDVLDHFRRALDMGRETQAAWNRMLEAYRDHYPGPAADLLREIAGELPEGWDRALPVHPAGEGLATRVASGHVLNALKGSLPGLLGGSADLNPSTKTELEDAGNFESPDRIATDLQGAAQGGWDYAGRNVPFGIREHGMGAILNGLAAHGGLLPFGGTFLVFSDYLRPSIRLAALMGLKVIYLFTHDSIAMGEDGPTHQAVEQLASLRAIPGLIVIRPGDANETTVAWQAALEAKDQPVALVLSRQDVPTLDREDLASAAGLRSGAYILSDADAPSLILIASGSELGLIVEAGRELRRQGLAVRLVSMPSWELFDAQSPAYRESVLPHGIGARLVVEAGIAQGWHRYAGDRGDVISVERFGASAPGPVVMREYGFTVAHVCERALALLGRQHV